MTRADLRFLVCCCSAFLPEREPESNDTDGGDQKNYYELLGVTEKATNEEIRRAYKKLSLQFHPDKIAQRRGTPSEVSVQDFQKIKEAYETLMHPRKREVYDVMGPKAMPYLMNPSSIEAQTVAGNLAKATLGDRMKVVIGFLLIWAILLIQPILICVKVDSDLEVSWVILLIPTWFLNSLAFLFLIRMVIAARKHAKKEEQNAESPGDVSQAGPSTIVYFSTFSKFFCIVASEILLALKFDHTLSSPYALVFIPVYIYVVIRLVEAVHTIFVENANVAKMATISMVEEESGRSYTDLTSDERDAVNEKYIIVHTPPNTQEVSAEFKGLVNEMDILQSPEFQLSQKRISESYSEVVSVVFQAVFIGVLVPHLDIDALDWNWWLVFLPVWIRFFFLCTSSCYQICCKGPTIPNEDEGEQVFDEEEEGEEEDGEDEEGKEEIGVKAALDDATRTLETGENADIESNHELVNDKVDEDADEEISVDEGNKKSPKLRVVVDADSTNTDIECINTNTDELNTDSDESELLFNEDIDDIFESDSEHEGEDKSSAVEATMKAMGTCCSTLFYIIIACLFVGKLDADSYSSFWVIFPILLPVGLFLCLSSCGIMFFRGSDYLKTGNTQDNPNNEVTAQDEEIGIENAFDLEDEKKDISGAKITEKSSDVTTSQLTIEASDFGDLD